MNQSEQINELAAALAKAQGEMKAPTKNKTAKIQTKAGGSYTYRYSDLAGTIEAGKPLSANGLSCSQLINMTPSLHLEAVLMHSSGQWISSTYPLTFHGTPQEFGSQLTYARRYLISCLLGIAADEDDDGAGATGGNKNNKAPLPPPVVSEDAQPPSGKAPEAIPAPPLPNIPVSDMGITGIYTVVDAAIHTGNHEPRERAIEMWKKVAGIANADGGLEQIVKGNKIKTDTPTPTIEHYTRNIADAVMKAAQPA